MRSAFTLIELLVVITIIVVLLAMLTPALDKAIYQAQLTVCGTQCREIASGVTMYASDNRRHYPDRGIVSSGQAYASDQAAEIKYTPVVTQRVDQRPILKKALPALSAQLNDPLAGRIDVEDAGSLIVFAPYNLWWDFKYANGRAMTKLGDRWSVGKDEFEVLVGDRDLVRPAPGNGASGPEAQSSHADDVYERGVLHAVVLQNQQAPWLITTGENTTLAMWYSGENTTAQRGMVDDNFGMSDLSVLRFNRVVWNSDPRLRKAPTFAGTGGYEYHYVP